MLSKSSISYHFKQSVFSILFFGTLLIISAALLLCSPLRIIKNSWYRAYSRLYEQLAGSCMIVLSYHFAPFQLVLTGDHHLINTGQHKRMLIMSNHQTYLDWWYFWSFAWLKHAHGDLRFLLMDYIKYVPIFGWACYLSEFIFLKQKWTKDQSILTRQLQKIRKSSHPFWFLIYPEGTLNTPNNKETSMSYAKKMNIGPHPKHVILPKTTGSWSLIQEVSPEIHTLLDVTMGYSGITSTQIAYEEYLISNVFFKGRFPEQIHLHFRLYDTNKIPSMLSKLSQVQDKESLKSMFDVWLRSRFMEKDVLMESFYKFGQFMPQVLKQNVSYLQEPQIDKEFLEKCDVAKINETIQKSKKLSDQKTDSINENGVDNDDHRLVLDIGPDLGDYFFMIGAWYIFWGWLIPIYTKIIYWILF